MSFTVRKRLVVDDGAGGISLTGLVSAIADKRTHFTKSIAGSAVDVQLDVPVELANIVGFALAATGALTVKTNDSVAPDDTFSLTATDPTLWVYGEVASVPLSQDITSIYVTNPGATAVVLTLFAAHTV